MFVRVSTAKGTNEQLDAMIGLVQDRIEPSLRTQAGFVGSVILLERESGLGYAATYWQTVADLSAAEDMGQAARAEAGAQTGVQLIDVDRFEHILLDRVAPPSGSGFARTTELRGSPEKIDALKGLLNNSVSTLRSTAATRSSS